jgi:hypothetical protein
VAGLEDKVIFGIADTTDAYDVAFVGIAIIWLFEKQQDYAIKYYDGPNQFPCHVPSYCNNHHIGILTHM